MMMSFSRRSRKKSKEKEEKEKEEMDKEEAGEGDKAGEHSYSLEQLDILKVIGTGTFARVCLARDRTSRRYLALKILNMADVIKLKQGKSFC